MGARVSRIQREIRQTRPFRSATAEALVALMRTTDQVRRRLARVLEPRGITLQQYNVLRILRGAGRAGRPTLEVAERMIEAAPGVTRLLDRLEAKRLVRRERCRRDRRQVLCWITPQGLRLLASLEAPVAAADRAALGGLSAARLARLTHTLDAVRAALAAPSDSPLSAGSRTRPAAGHPSRRASQGDEP